jgi:hypothetical protein
VATDFWRSDVDTFPNGAVALSDAVDLHIDPQSDLAVSLFLPDPSLGTTQPALAHQTSYISPTGDFTGQSSMPVASTTSESGGPQLGHNRWLP